MEDCVFCKLAACEIPSDTVYEDDDIVAFLDIAPVNSGHTLVIPKRHYRTVADMQNGAVGVLFTVANRIGNCVRDAMSAEGVNMVVNSGEVAGQEVFHAHIHLIPRFRDDGLKGWPKRQVPEAEMQAAGESIRARLAE